MNTLIVMLSGKQGSGKTTTSRALKAHWEAQGIPVLTYKFAQPLYDMHNVLYTIAKDYGIEPPADGMDKTLLQLLGTEWGRNTRGKNIWIRCAQRKIAQMTDGANAAGLFHIVIIDDLRFKNELLDTEAGAVSVRIECDRDTRFKRCSCWRDNETHASEVDLDDMLDKFNLVVDASNNETAALVGLIDAECRKRFPDTRRAVPTETVLSSSVVMPKASEMKPVCS